jgi:hypothetical protein
MSSLAAFDLFNVKGRVAVVTGGSSGIGLMISKVSVTLGISMFKVDCGPGTYPEWCKSLPRCIVK